MLDKFPVNEEYYFGKQQLQLIFSLLVWTLFTVGEDHLSTEFFETVIKQTDTELPLYCCWAECPEKGYQDKLQNW